MSSLSDCIVQNVSEAIKEDVGDGDITASLIPGQTNASATVICRQSAVIAGQQWFDETFRQIDKTTHIEWQVNDGDSIEPNTCICTIKGKASSLLTAERTALNFLQTLSAVSTRTKQYVDAISHTKTKILDTRKTIPGLRLAQKYAVTCGGGENHRKGLYDGFLIKENHIMAAGSISNAIQQAKSLNTLLPIEVEVESLDELKQALDANADIVLLDNMNIAMLQQAVSLTQGKAKLEASGNVTLEGIGAIAETGVDFISIGDLTKNINAIDLSMRF